MPQMSLREFKRRASLPKHLETWDEVADYINSIRRLADDHEGLANEVVNLRHHSAYLQEEVEKLQDIRDELAFGLGMSVAQGRLLRPLDAPRRSKLMTAQAEGQ